MCRVFRKQTPGRTGDAVVPAFEFVLEFDQFVGFECPSGAGADN